MRNENRQENGGRRMEKERTRVTDYSPLITDY
jgi:hypothetical protein